MREGSSGLGISLRSGYNKDFAANGALTIRKAMSVAENINYIRTHIREVSEGLDTSAVTLVAVTKSAELFQIEEAYRTGVTEFGESRVQDALTKMKLLPESLINGSRWHFIGHLQTNKVKQAIGRFDLIHSVDSLKLAQEISRISQQKQIQQAVLLQVKILDDPSKTGFSMAELQAQFEAIIALPAIEVKGLMTITPLSASREERIACFNGLRELRDSLTRLHKVSLPELSMGMSSDWQEAIPCGATLIRVGSRIFHH